ncbi:hypothetical protein M0R89_00510 [Halorussus limi]|uniref:Uncharacterized protein n=1 Tax=Halorussus limi TaxID=2938695 RepID=A0A8U0HUI0_9EURY|nr:hypothetical protein [Halorussus limi]UPV74567.1 hypothetical protein M0R89_00510 [Halorussus limi]
MSESVYSVYLVQRPGEQGGKREVTSPVRGHELKFYDSGVWLDREEGRNFFPYDQIRTIREHPEDRGDERADDERADDEQVRTPDESDAGAEEEMLE